MSKVVLLHGKITIESADGAGLTLNQKRSISAVVVKTARITTGTDRPD